MIKLNSAKTIYFTFFFDCFSTHSKTIVYYVSKYSPQSPYKNKIKVSPHSDNKIDKICPKSHKSMDKVCHKN